MGETPMAVQTAKRRKGSVGPYTAHKDLSAISLRSVEGRILKKVRADLLEEIGGVPTASQRVLLDRAAMLNLQIALMDRKAVAAGSMTEHDQRTYIAWVNALTKCMKQLRERRPAPSERKRPMGLMKASEP